MQISDFLAQAGGISGLADALGVSEQQAAAGAQALLPSILGGFRKQVEAPQGGLGDLLSQFGGGGLLDAFLPGAQGAGGAGNDILGQIFGSKDVSRQVAANASSQTGLDPALLKKMLPMLAMLVASFMAKQGGGQTQSEGGLGGLLGGLFGGNAPAQTRTAQGGGLGGLIGMLDANGDGNPLDDILRMVGKLR